MMIDPSIKLEAAFFEGMYTTQAKALLHDQLCVELPARGRNDSLPDILVGVERVRNTVVYAFASDSARAGVNIVVEWVRALALSAAPSFTAVGDDQHLHDLQSRLRFLFRHTQVAEDGSEVTYFGEPAMARRIAELDAEMRNGTLTDLGCLKALDAFSWMLTAEQKTKQASWVQELFKQRGMARGPEPVRANAPCGRAANSASAASSRKAAAKASASSTMDLFKRRRG